MEQAFNNCSKPIADIPGKIDRLCELNVIEQARHVCQTTIVQEAWGRGQALAIHGWGSTACRTGSSVTWACYSTSDVNGIDATYHAALTALGAGQAIEARATTADQPPRLSL